MTNLDWLKNFVAVYRAGSVSGAAEARHLTQPAVSQQLSALENYIGEVLFQRTPKGMMPTERGKALYAQIYDSLDKLERVGRSLRKRSASTAPVLRLGTSPEYFHSFALEQLTGTDLRLQVSFADIKELLAQLELGLLDAVIGAHRPTARGLEYRVLAEKRFSLIAPKHLEAPRTKAQRREWLAQQSWVAYSLDLPLVRRFWQQTFNKTFDATLALVTPDLRSVLKAVELGWGVSIVPNFLSDEAVERGSVYTVMPIDDVIPLERWLLVCREVDSDRLELTRLQELLSVPQFLKVAAD